MPPQAPIASSTKQLLEESDMSSRADIERYLEQQYTAAGIPPNVGKAIVGIESGWNPQAKNKSSTAGGLMQFLDGTARAYGLANKYDPYQSIDASIRYLKDAQRMGIDVTNPGHAYLAWQQGAGGAKKILSAAARNPSAPIESIIGVNAAKLNALSGLSAAQAVAKWGGKANKIAGVPSGYSATLPKSMQPDLSVEQPADEQATAPKPMQFAGANFEAAAMGDVGNATMPKAVPDMNLNSFANPYVKQITPTFFSDISMNSVPMLAALRKVYG